MRRGVLAAGLALLVLGLGGSPASPAPNPSLATTSSPAPGGAAGTSTVVQIVVNGALRSYRLFTPSTPGSGARPLLFALHGLGATAASYETVTGLDVEAGRAGVYVVYPDGLDKSWNGGTCCGPSSANNVDDVGFITAVLDDVYTRAQIDRRKLAISGASNGGIMAYRYACERSDRIDVAVVLSGVSVAPSCSVFYRPVSLLHVHGNADTVVPIAGTSSSPYSSAGFPDVRDAIVTFAAMDGCTNWTMTQPRSDVRHYSPTCPAGTFVSYITSAGLRHSYVTGSADESRLGIDETKLTWSFTTGTWNKRP